MCSASISARRKLPLAEDLTMRPGKIAFLDLAFAKDIEIFDQVLHLPQIAREGVLK